LTTISGARILKLPLKRSCEGEKVKIMIREFFNADPYQRPAFFSPNRSNLASKSRYREAMR
jgi:hypothetical protein